MIEKLIIHVCVMLLILIFIRESDIEAWNGGRCNVCGRGPRLIDTHSGGSEVVPRADFEALKAEYKKLEIRFLDLNGI